MVDLLHQQHAELLDFALQEAFTSLLDHKLPKDNLILYFLFKCHKHRTKMLPGCVHIHYMQMLNCPKLQEAYLHHDKSRPQLYL